LEIGRRGRRAAQVPSIRQDEDGTSVSTEGSGVSGTGLGQGGLAGAGCYRGGTHHFYRCGRNSNRHPGLEKTCPQKKVRGDVLELFAWEYVLRVITNPEDFEKALRDAQTKEQDSLRPKREQLAIVVEQIAESERDAAEISEALKKVSRGGAVEKSLLVDMDRVERLYAEQIKRRDELEAAVNERKLTDDNIAAAMSFREDVMLGLQNPTLNDIRQAFELLHVEVTVKDHQAVVNCYLPAEPGSLDFRALDFRTLNPRAFDLTISTGRRCPCRIKRSNASVERRSMISYRSVLVSESR
jgi:hypothetical protein